MTDLRKAAQAALKALEAQHTDRLAYSNARRKANATCGEFKDSPLAALIESGYMQSMGKQTKKAIYALHAALAAQPEPVGRLHADGYFTWNRRDGYVLDAKLPCDFYLAPAAQQDEPVAEVVEDDFSRQVKGIGRWHDLPNGTLLYAAAQPQQAEKPATPQRCAKPSLSCPNMKDRENDTSMTYEHYDCKVCGGHIALDYEDMK